MMDYIKKHPLILLSSLMLSFGVTQVNAEVWNLDNLVAQSTQQKTSYFFYVGKGESWKNIQFQSQFTSNSHSSLIGLYDNQIIHRQNLTGQGEFSFTLPAGTTGFHRLDLILLQKPIDRSGISENYCIESSDLYTSLTHANLTYQPSRSTSLLNQLPDALFNPQLSRATPIQAQLSFNPNSHLEASMISRIATAWNFATPIQWQTSENSQQASDFVIRIQKSKQTLPTAKVSIDQPNNIPTLNIEYSSESQLLMATNALLNQPYLQQLNTASISLNGASAEPTWATMRKFENLADLGISDFELENSPKNIALNFPPVWDATDVLQGKLAFRAQSGLLQGSTLQIWINEYLAGSLSLARLDSTPIERQFDFVGADHPYTTSYNVSLISSQLNDESCLPNTGGALWIDAQKSIIHLPHQLKKGVISLSSAVANQPDIAMNNAAGTAIAITLVNVTKKMLLNDAPIPINISQFNLAAPKNINIVVNAVDFKKELQKYSQILYLPATENGFLITIKDGKFWIYTDNVMGAQTFTQFWSTIQQKIPNNTSTLFVSAQGNLTVLNTMPVKHVKAPIVEQISTSTIAIILATIAMLIISLIFWRRTRKTKGDLE